MSSKQKNTNQEEERESIGSIAGALECITGWEKLRGRRNMADGSLKESEMKLAGVTGNLTDLELVTHIVNAKEMHASEAVLEWRRSITFDPAPNQSSNTKRDSSAELLEIYELFRAVLATRDPALIGFWMSEQSYPVQFLILNLFSKILLRPHE